LHTPLLELLEIKPDGVPDFVNLTVTFVHKDAPKADPGSEQILKEVPEVRVYFEASTEEQPAEAKPTEEAVNAGGPPYGDYGDESYY